MTAPIELQLQFKMTSDWHVGTGSGRHGGIDRLVARDADGLPYIPASTWRGLWRDAAELLARGLDEMMTGDWQDLVMSLFGSQPSHANRGHQERPLQSRIFPTDARLSKAIRSHLVGPGSRSLLRDALSFVKPGVAIDETSGAARSDFLHFEEMAISGTVLEASATINIPVEDKAIEAFLVGAAHLIERIGGKRRRGNGRCTVTVKSKGREFSAKDAAEVLRNAADIPEFMPANSGATSAGSYASVGTWHDIPISITLESPLVISDEVLGNVITTLDHIPGSALVPIVADAAAKGGLEHVGARLACSDLRVLPATIDISGDRGLPVPLCWSTRKDAPRTGPVGVISDLLAKRDRDVQLKPLRTGYITRAKDGGARIRSTLPTEIRTHNVVSDKTQTPTDDVGGVFSYEALRPRLTFRSLVRIRADEKTKNALRSALERGFATPIRLGRGKQAGYGIAKMRVGADGSGKGIDRAPFRFADADPSVPSHVVVWLATDTLLPGDDLAGATDVDALIHSVEFAIGKGPIFKRAECRAWLRTRRIQSWQSRWHLPRPSLVAVQAGSVLLLALEAGAKLDDDVLAEAEKEGIGERRAEGFGVIRFNDVTVTQKIDRLEKVKNSDEKDVGAEGSADASISAGTAELTDIEKQFLDGVIERAWKRRILARAEAVMSDPNERRTIAGWDDRKVWPSMSQLGGLRAVLPSIPANCAAEDNPVKKWIDGQDKKGRGREGDNWSSPWSKAKDLVTKPAAIWSALGLAEDDGCPSAGRSGGNDLRANLWSFAVMNTLLIAIRHHKRATEKRDEDTPQSAEAAT